jgi:hypothetical protein
VYLHHIEGWDSFRDADDELDPGIGSFQNGIGRERGRNKNHRGVGASLLSRFSNRVENGLSLMRGSTFAWRDTPHDVCPVGLALQGVKRALAARDALHNESRVLVN